MTMCDNRDAPPLFDVHPVTGASFEVFYTDRSLESFGRLGAGWYWWPRRRGFAPEGSAVGPFPTKYSAYRLALLSWGSRCSLSKRKWCKVNADIVRTS
jgi:hypothetical protein